MTSVTKIFFAFAEKKEPHLLLTSFLPFHSKDCMGAAYSLLICLCDSGPALIASLLGYTVTGLTRSHRRRQKKTLYLPLPSSDFEEYKKGFNPD